ncbi:MAG: transglutaminase-like domain-containing protein [Candidatus Bathyarchaeia archaeon]
MRSSQKGKSNIGFLLLAFISLIALYGAYRPKYVATLERTFWLTTKVVYENKSTNETWTLRDEDVTIGLFMNNSWQEVYLVYTSYPIKKFSNDSDGNTVILLDVGDMKVPPGRRLSYLVTYRLVFKERSIPIISEDLSGELDDIPLELKEKFCKPTSLWHFNVTEIRELAQEIAGGERRVLTILKEFISWIARNIHYATSEVPRYPNETINQRLGDCDDQANLLITLCRAVGIPAYLQIGCIYIPGLHRSFVYWSGHLMIRQTGIGWHGWAMVYVPPWGWLPVDLTYVHADLKVEPLSAILHSAVIEHYTFQYSNITVSDYISEIVSIKKFIEKSMFYICEDDFMDLEKSVVVPRPPLVKLVHPAVIVLRLFTITAMRRRYIYWDANSLYS